MKIGFDHEKYLEEQSKYILERVNNHDKLYIEFGGKLLGDLHAKRVLPGFDENAKIKVTLSANKKISKTIKLSISGKKKAVFGEVVKVTGKNFNKEVLKAKGKVIVDYSAKWCGYCRLLEPIYKEAAKVRPLYKFTVVDADEEEELVEGQGIGGFPTLHLYENGKLIKEGGYMQDMTVWDLIDWIESK